MIRRIFADSTHPFGVAAQFFGNRFATAFVNRLRRFTSGKRKTALRRFSVSGGAGRNRTGVRKCFTLGSTCLAQSLDLTVRYPMGRNHARRFPLVLTSTVGTPVHASLAKVTVQSVVQARAGEPLTGIKRLERSCRRSQLTICRWIYEETCILGMHLKLPDPRRSQVSPRPGIVAKSPKFNPPQLPAGFMSTFSFTYRHTWGRLPPPFLTM